MNESLHSTIKLVLVNHDELIARPQLNSGNIAIRVFNGAYIPLMRSFDDHNRCSDVPVFRATSHVTGAHHTACGLDEGRVHLRKVSTRLDQTALWCYGNERPRPCHENTTILRYITIMEEGIKGLINMQNASFPSLSVSP